MQAIYKEFGMIVEPLLDTFLFCFYLEIYQIIIYIYIYIYIFMRYYYIEER